jgi:protein CWC15
MTTAHRPTWKAAVARANQSGNFSMAVSELDAPAHTKLKLRQGPQVVDRSKALRESLAKLEEAESKAKTKVLGRRPVNLALEQQARQKLLTHTADIDDEAIRSKYDDSDVVHEGDDQGGGKSNEPDQKPNDKPDDDASDLDASDSEEEDNDDDDEDDEAALQAELAKIRAEREAAQAKVQAQASAEESSKMEEAALLGNPLLVGAGAISGKMKRKWNDDVVFRNQAKGEPQVQKRFINDTVRNDFHRRFLNKFMR